MDKSSVASLMDKVNDAVINPLLALLFAAGLLVFVFGVVEFVLNVSDTEGKERGKQHMLWGVIGMFIMAASYAIFRLIVSLVGADQTF